MTVAQAKRWFGSLSVLPDASVRLHGRLLRTISVLEGTELLPHP
jgi:hypothetical protein